MGDVAEDFINGSCCLLCGQYFIDKNDELFEHGYEVVCKDCWTDLTKEEKNFYTKATANTI